MNERICHLWSRGRHFSPSLPGDRYLKLGSKSQKKKKSRAKISGSIVWYNALARRPEQLRVCCLVCACALSIDINCSPYAWKKDISIHLSKYHTFTVLGASTREQDQVIGYNLQFHYQTLKDVIESLMGVFW